MEAAGRRAVGLRHAESESAREEAGTGRLEGDGKVDVAPRPGQHPPVVDGEWPGDVEFKLWDVET